MHVVEGDEPVLASATGLRKLPHDDGGRVCVRARVCNVVMTGAPM